MKPDSRIDLTTLRSLFEPDQPLLAMADAGLVGLTDAEYLWEPVGGCWSVRPRAELRVADSNPEAWPEGDWGVDIVYPDPDPSPFTTIAWRLVHMTGSVYTAAASLRGARRVDGTIDGRWTPDLAVPTTAGAAVRRWSDAIATLRDHLKTATEEDLDRRERHFWEPEPCPVWSQVFYYAYFEPASHAAEIRLLRDLYRHQSAADGP